MKIKKEGLSDKDEAFQKYKPRKKFSKIHERAHRYLENMFDMLSVPLTLSDITLKLK